MHSFARQLSWVLLLLSFVTCPAAAESIPAIEPVSYTGTPAARAAWKPLSGSPPVELAQVENRPALRMQCPFADGQLERGSWDLSATLDLSSARGVELDIYCRNSKPVSYFSLYFKSGAGWYHISFFPEVDGWSTVKLDKTSSGIEGIPAGWSKIDGIRISAWRGANENTEFYLGGIRRVGELGVDSAIAIIRSDSAGAQERASVEQYTERVFKHLADLQIGASVLSDADVSPERLRHARIVILPHNPNMRASAVDALVNFVRSGGKIISFYTLPSPLHQPMGIQSGPHTAPPYLGAFAEMRFTPGALAGAPASVTQQSWNINAYKPSAGARVIAEWFDAAGKPSGHPAIIGSTNGFVVTHVLLTEDPARKKQMLLAMTGALYPEIWTRASTGAIARIGEISGYKNFAEAQRQIAQAGSDEVVAALNEASSLQDRAKRLAASGKYPEAIETASSGARRMKEAFCLAQSPAPGEFRAFWCHSAFGVQGLTWDEALARLKQNGFNAILPNLLWGGVAFYPSETLPVAKATGSRGDQMTECLAAARKHGLEVHVWKVNWNLGNAAPQEFVARMRSENRLQMSATGQQENWLCPSHPANQDLEIDSMVEIARKHPVTGIHFDYIRYPGGDYCLCTGCRQRFQAAQNTVITNWPAAVLKDGALRQPWLEWRRSHITRVVREVSKAARAARPGLQISAAVFRNWPSDRDSVAQDWKLWCDQGYLDFVCPMDYTESHRSFENMVSDQVRWAGKARCYPGIGASTAGSSFGVEGVISQIKIARKHNTGGFVIFNYGVTESQDLLPLLGLGITRP